MLSATLKERIASGKKVLVAYIVAGDPVPQATVPLMHTLVKAGVDVIELGMPFSDPEAEGPVIQLAHERALRHDVSIRDCLEMNKAFRRDDQTTPVVLMGYLNPIEMMGYEKFADDALDAGINGTILVNLPPEESGSLTDALEERGIEPVYLLAPTTTDERAAIVCKASRGFVYYVSLKGTTGAATLNVSDVAEKMARFREISTLPVLVGFGVKDPESAQQVAELADGVVVGSAIVDRMNQHQDDLEVMNAEIGAFVASLRAAID